MHYYRRPSRIAVLNNGYVWELNTYAMVSKAVVLTPGRNEAETGLNQSRPVFVRCLGLTS